MERLEEVYVHGKELCTWPLEATEWLSNGQTTKKQGPQPYNQKGANSVNNLNMFDNKWILRGPPHKISAKPTPGR